MQRGTEDQIAGLAKMVVAAEAETVAEACGRPNGQLQEDQMKPEIGIQLKHRYDQLPAGLKHLMLYLSPFPKGYRINKKRLLYRWIAEGIVTDLKHGESLLELFESYLNEVMAKELVELDNVDNDGCTTCQVPGVMHNFLMSDAISQGFSCLVGSTATSSSYGGGDSQARLLSVHGDNPAAGLEGKDMSYLRSLSLFDPQDHHKLLDRLAEFTQLRMLDLEGCTAVEDLAWFLSFNDADITVIPDEIGGLENL
ncbi:hypothetical protein U9M48_004979 [Paspalum notatum var. saurae]|uniref:Disease resistance protein winged helix domain-containing protein n=1 Tax=Paspalum notatum var. saurae TaxID=547442 RepID=A0AAQ3PVU7_PASNO